MLPVPFVVQGYLGQYAELRGGQSPMRPLRIWIVGFGTVGQWLAGALESQAERLAVRYGVGARVVFE